jgi:hypothetical protein
VRKRWLLDRSAVEAESVAKHMQELPLTNVEDCSAHAATETDAMTSLYESDFFASANEQASLLRAGKLSSADIESMGKREKQELVG